MAAKPRVAPSPLSGLMANSVSAGAAPPPASGDDDGSLPSLLGCCAR
jgi:hypothetical protein